ncbi:MAG: hypothetical protein J0L82_08105 [Deltaproteobacteria bacterium]|nr:hypothetical protein [Deltaproteobacteria bacterium]
MKHHESAAEMHAPQLGSDRSFGFVFATIFLAIGIYQIVAGQIAHGKIQISNYSGILLFLAFLLFAISILSPNILRVPNLLWFKLGLKLHIIFSFAVMALLFFGLFLPIGVVLKILGKTPIPQTENAERETYWVRRESNPQIKKQDPDQWTDFNFQF